MEPFILLNRRVFFSLVFMKSFARKERGSGEEPPSDSLGLQKNGDQMTVIRKRYTNTKRLRIALDILLLDEGDIGLYLFLYTDSSR